MGKSAALLIVFGAVFVIAWVILGIGFLHRLTGWPLEAGSALGGVGIILFLAGVSIARRRAS